MQISKGQTSITLKKTPKSGYLEMWPTFINDYNLRSIVDLNICDRRKWSFGMDVLPLNLKVQENDRGQTSFQHCNKQQTFFVL